MVFELLVEVVTVSVIDCTGQVVKFSGTLVTLPMVAKRGVRPGTLAVTWTCPWSKPMAVVLSVATLGIRVCQLKTPTVVGDVHAAAERIRLIDGGLIHGIARIGGGRLVRRHEQAHRDFIDVLMHVNRGRRAAYPLGGRRDHGHAHRSGCTDLWVAQRIPAAGAGQSVVGHGEHGSVTGLVGHRLGDRGLGGGQRSLPEMTGTYRSPWTAFGLGVRVTLAGTAKLVVVTALLLPHPVRPATSKK